MEWILPRYQGEDAPVLVTVRRCGPAQTGEFFALQQEVRAAMPDPALFMPNTEAELAAILQDGLGIGVYDGARLAAFLLLRCCGVSEHNYAAALGLPAGDWPFWANGDSIVVHPDYRGNGLQRRMTLLAEQWRHPSIIGIACTVSPANPHSLDNVRAVGYEIAARKPMYGGQDRYILAKRLPPLPGIYRHFKGGRYQVMALARDSETEGMVVVYRALYGERQLWVRPASMWFEHVDREDYHGPRFVWEGEGESGEA